MQMKSAILSGAALVFLATAPSMAAGPVLGRISYIYPDGRHLILDGQKEYAIAGNMDMGRHGVAEFVQLTLGPDNQVTAIKPGPANLAAYWAPRDPQS